MTHLTSHNDILPTKRKSNSSELSSLSGEKELLQLDLTGSLVQIEHRKSVRLSIVEGPGRSEDGRVGFGRDEEKLS